MRVMYSSIFVLALAASSALGGSVGPRTGQKAPAFELQGSDGKTWTLKQFLGKTAVVVAWYPKAFTGG